MNELVGHEKRASWQAEDFLEVSGEGIERVNQAALSIPDSSCPEQRLFREQGDQEDHLRSIRDKLLGLHFYKEGELKQRKRYVLLPHPSMLLEGPWDWPRQMMDLGLATERLEEHWRAPRVIVGLYQSGHQARPLATSLNNNKDDFLVNNVLLLGKMYIGLHKFKNLKVKPTFCAFYNEFICPQSNEKEKCNKSVVLYRRIWFTGQQTF